MPKINDRNTRKDRKTDAQHRALKHHIRVQAGEQLASLDQRPGEAKKERAKLTGTQK